MSLAKFSGVAKKFINRSVHGTLSIILAFSSLAALTPLLFSQTAYAAAVDVCPSGCLYSTIQEGIDAAGAGDTVNVEAGTYTGNVSLNKAVTLEGAGSSDSIITGQVTISSNNVALDGFTINNPSGTEGVVIPHVSGVTVSNNVISNIGTSVTNDNVYGIWYQGSTAVGTASDIAIEDNQLSNIGSVANAHSNGGILIGDSASHENITSGLTISGNTLSDISSSTKGAYGILVNLGSGAGTASVTGATISGNSISGLSGGWKHAIGLEADTPNASLSSNTVSGDSAVTAVRFEENPSASTVSMSGNTLNGDNLSNSTATVAVEADWSALSTASNTYTEVSLNGQYYYYGLNAFDTIASGVSAVTAGGTVNVAAGTYNENVSISQDLTLNGAGSGTDGTIIQPTSGSALTISGSGTAGTPLTIKNLRVTTNSSSGVYFDSTVSHVALDNVATVNNSYGIEVHNNAALNDLSLSSVSATGNAVAMRVRGQLDGLTITNSHFDSNQYGLYSGDSTTLQLAALSNVSVSGSTFNDNTYRGMYFDALDHASFDNIQVEGTSAGTGVDINLKYRTSYSTISFTNSVISNTTGTGIYIKARNDGGYATNPAALNGVTLTGNTITSNTRGVAIENNVTDVTLLHNKLSGNTSGDVADWRVVGTGGIASADSINATGNWWGNALGPDSSQYSGDVTVSPWCAQSGCTSYTTGTANLSLGASGGQASTPSSGSTTLNGSGSTSGLTATIPASTQVTSKNSDGTTNTSWDGVIQPPAVTSYTVPGNNTTSLAITVGTDDGSNLTFDQPVKLLLAGQAGKLVGFLKNGSFTQISTACSSAAPTIGELNALDPVGACYRNSGSDLIVWTDHFTTFATYSKSATSSSSSSTTSTTSSVSVSSLNLGGSHVLGAKTSKPSATQPIISAASTTNPSIVAHVGWHWYDWLIVALSIPTVLAALAYIVRTNSRS